MRELIFVHNKYHRTILGTRPCHYSRNRNTQKILSLSPRPTPCHFFCYRNYSLIFFGLQVIQTFFIFKWGLFWLYWNCLGKSCLEHSCINVEYWDVQFEVLANRPRIPLVTTMALLVVRFTHYSVATSDRGRNRAMDRDRKHNPEYSSGNNSGWRYICR